MRISKLGGTIIIVFSFDEEQKTILLDLKVRRGRNIYALQMIDGKVPDNMEDLLKLPGVGRKTANLILGDVYNVPSSVVVDTHCIRISNRIGLVHVKDPVKIETALREILPGDKSNNFCHRLVLHGRAVCTARSPKCENCSIRPYCDFGSGKEE